MTLEELIKALQEFSSNPENSQLPVKIFFLESQALELKRKLGKHKFPGEFAIPISNAHVGTVIATGKDEIILHAALCEVVIKSA